MTASEEAAIQGILQPAIDLLVGMPAEARDAWMDWFVDRVADARQLSPRQGAAFLVALYRHLLNRISEEADTAD